jgi:uncharacterized protein with FMN-binding domain
VKRAVLALVSTIAALVLLLSFKTHTVGAVATPPAAIGSVPPGSSTSAGGSSDGTQTSTSGTGGSSASASASATAKSYTGDAVNTPYGPVEVRVTVKSGRIVDVTAVEYPVTDPRDAQINAYAIPALNSEVLAAGSANIDMISGATYTSEGYITSLQSALDRAGV